MIIFPLAYLLTFRTYGTWLHGDERGSVDVHGKNIYGTPDISFNPKLKKQMEINLSQSPFVLNKTQQNAVKEAIQEVCSYRKYNLQAINVRSNHIHTVVTAQKKPEFIVESFKKYATRKLREQNLVSSEKIIWSKGQSRRYLWKSRSVSLAIEYVLYGQGDDLAEILKDD